MSGAQHHAEPSDDPQSPPLRTVRAQWELTLLLSALHRSMATELEPLGGIPRWIRAHAINQARALGSDISIRGEAQSWRTWATNDMRLAQRLQLPWDHPLLWKEAPVRPEPGGGDPHHTDPKVRAKWLLDEVIAPMMPKAKKELQPSFKLPRQRPGTKVPSCEMALHGTHQWALSLGGHGELTRALSGRNVRLIVLPRDATGARRVLSRSLLDPELCQHWAAGQDPGGDLLQQYKAYPAVLAYTWLELERAREAGQSAKIAHPLGLTALLDLAKLSVALLQLEGQAVLDFGTVELKAKSEDADTLSSWPEEIQIKIEPLAEDMTVSKEQLQLALAQATDRAENCPYEVQGHHEEAWNTIASRLMPIHELRPGQQEMLRTRHEQKRLVILPTAYGKSLPVMLTSMISSGRHLMVVPLKALANDHVRGLQHLGLKGSSPKSTGILESGMNIITPERLQGELLKDITQNPPRSLNIDEVHTISELGHDFRPGVLRSIKVWHQLTIPRTGLTGTAPTVVAEDLKKTLQTSETIQGADGRRPELRLAIRSEIASPDDSERRRQMLEETLLISHPTILQLSPEALYPARDAEHGTLIFAAYADAHATGTVEDSVGVLAQRTREILNEDPEQELTTGRIRVHGSKPPTLCPQCDSPNYVNKGRISVCRSCGQEFQAAKAAPNWDRQMAIVASEYDREQFPVLCATRSYGMGIDRQRIRSVVHNGISVSIEAYLQEAGRGARAGEDAACTIITALPTNSCRVALAQNPVPPCLGKPCPHGLGSNLCDVGRQGRLIEQSFPAVGSEVTRAMKVWENPNQETDDLAAWRLEILGAASEWLGQRGLQSLSPSAEQLEENLTKAGIQVARGQIRSLSDALHVLITAQRERSRRSRFEMLQAMHALAEQEQACRWSAIGAAMGWSTEPCGRCDICRANGLPQASADTGENNSIGNTSVEETSTKNITIAQLKEKKRRIKPPSPEPKATEIHAATHSSENIVPATTRAAEHEGSEAPESQAPESQAPESQAPESQAPESQGLSKEAEAQSSETTLETELKPSDPEGREEHSEKDLEPQITERPTDAETNAENAEAPSEDVPESAQDQEKSEMALPQEPEVSLVSEEKREEELEEKTTEVQDNPEEKQEDAQEAEVVTSTEEIQAPQGAQVMSSFSESSPVMPLPDANGADQGEMFSDDDSWEITPDTVLEEEIQTSPATVLFPGQNEKSASKAMISAENIDEGQDWEEFVYRPDPVAAPEQGASEWHESAQDELSQEEKGAEQPSHASKTSVQEGNQAPEALLERAVAVENIEELLNIAMGLSAHPHAPMLLHARTWREKLDEETREALKGLLLASTDTEQAAPSLLAAAKRWPELTDLAADYDPMLTAAWALDAGVPVPEACEEAAWMIRAELEIAEGTLKLKDTLKRLQQASDRLHKGAVR